MQAVVYCRVSGDSQEKDGTSLDTQEAHCIEYATAQGWQVVKLFRETSTGAKYRERPLLSTAREMIRSKQADVLLCYALDRLSRNQTHIAVIADDVEHCGGRLAFVTEDFEDSAVGRFLRQAKGFAAEVEREKIAERVQRGKRARVKEGKMYANRPLYGYRWIPAPPNMPPEEAKKYHSGRYESNPDSALVVQRIFKDYVAGKTLRAIAMALTDEGIPTARGNARWVSSSVRKVLIHPGYKGDAYAFVWKGKGGAFQETDESIKLPTGTIPPLVSASVWQAAQERMTVNKTMAARNNQYPEGALLRGIARCGHCGGLMHVVNTKKYGENGNKVRKIVYRCGTHTRNPAVCKERTIRAEVIDTAVWDVVSRVLQNPAIIAQEAERMTGENPVRDELASIERTLRETHKQYDNFMRAIGTATDANVIASIMVRVERLSKQKQELEGERDVVIARSEQWVSNVN